MWSPLQLKLANQYMIYSIRRLTYVEVDINVVKEVADFEVIEILEDINPYAALLGIVWAFGNNSILNLKQQRMPFETEEMRVVNPLDATEGEYYT